MKVKKLHIAFGVAFLLALAAGGHIALSSASFRAARKAIEDVEKGLPSGGSISFGNLGVSPYASAGGVRDMFYDSPRLSITATTVRVRDFAREGDDIKADIVGFEDVVITLKDKGIKYHIKRARAVGSNLAQVVRAVRRSSPEDLARMLQAREIVITDLTSSGKGVKLIVDEIKAGSIGQGSIGRLELKGMAVAEGGAGKSVGACSGDAVSVVRVGELAAATVSPDQGEVLISDVKAVCK